jgi:mevalonate kinase
LKVSATGNGKLLLFGEHAILYGYPALGVPIPLKAEVTAESDSIDKSLAVTDPAFIKKTEELLIRLITRQSLSTGLHDYRWTITSDVPAGSGLGSSAALCAAAAGCILGVQRMTKNEHTELSKTELLSRQWKLANHGEQIFHGKASGVDTALAIYSGLSLISPTDHSNPDVKSLDIPELFLVIATIPRNGNTKQHVMDIYKRFYDGDHDVQNAMKILGDLTLQGHKLLTTSQKHLRGDDFQQLGEYMNRAHSVLRDLGLVDNIQDLILDRCLQAGSPGGKMSGAGGGGAFYLLANSRQMACKLEESVNSMLRELVGIEQATAFTAHYSERGVTRVEW